MLDILFLSKPCQIYTLLLPFFLLLFPVTNNAYGSSTPQLLCLYLFSTDRAKGSLTTIPRLLCLLLPICLCRWEALAGDWKAGRKASQSRLSEWPRLCMMLFLFGSFRPKHCSGLGDITSFPLPDCLTHFNFPLVSRYLCLKHKLALKEINPEYSLNGLLLKLKLQSLATRCEEPTHWKRP